MKAAGAAAAANCLVKFGPFIAGLLLFFVVAVERPRGMAEARMQTSVV